MPQGQTTPEKTLSNPWHGKGFCEVNQYKSAIDRSEGGFKSLELGIDMFKSLQKINEEYSKALRDWAKSSQRQLAESKEFGTNRKAWLECIRSVEKLADHNDTIAEGVHEKVVEKMSTFKNNKYGKSFIHVKKIKEFDQEFKKAQKPWLEFVDKINDAKQGYHDATRKLQQAERKEELTRTDAGSTDEEKKKAKTTVEKRKSEITTCKSKYEKLIEDMDKKKENYQKEMFTILARTDEFEKERLLHFKDMFTALQDVILTDNTDHRTQLKAAFEKALNEHKIDEDIQYFNKHYGRDTHTKWPQFDDLKD